MIALIVAASENNVIGKDGGLPWRLPDDWKFFKETTMGHPLIMGRKTFESIGKPLPGRTNILVTRQNPVAWKGQDVKVVGSLQEAIGFASLSTGGEEIFIAGGGEVYREALPSSDRVYLTRVHTTIEGDTFFPALSLKEWREVSREDHPADDRHPCAFSFLVYERKTQVR